MCNNIYTLTHIQDAVDQLSPISSTMTFRLKFSVILRENTVNASGNDPIRNSFKSLISVRYKKFRQNSNHWSSCFILARYDVFKMSPKPTVWIHDYDNNK